ncbi:DNA methyltransferase [Halogranum tailed virus 1]|uniref:Cytosine-specific methyltransferase n=1 Tax=Halogranum tailed virus 1 TaxID=1273749 RepID=R4TMW4_9CAUD|nr:DNA methyltransferase [Halogranum tailed virus 1]AGM11533.1 AdoMet-MTase [Halogranum tailed virus 1]
MSSRITSMENVLDLFCGAGGLSHGFEQAGYRVLAGVDVWDDALETYRLNHPSVGLEVDMHTVEPSELPLSKEQVDVVIGGPPCKGFSLAGERDSDDERNQLVARFLDYVEYFEPATVVMENVVGILSMDLPGYDGSVPDYIHDRLRSMGFETDHQTLDATNYGIAQTRRRVFFVGTRGRFPSYPKPTTADVTMPVAGVLEYDFTGFPNHTYTNHQQSTIDKMAALDYEESVYDTYQEAWKRLHPLKPAPTIKENHNAPFVHYSEDRVGTPRECTAIQTFPNNYEFRGTKSSVLKQIGNAVPPELARHVAKALSE